MGERPDVTGKTVRGDSHRGSKTSLPGSMGVLFGAIVVSSAINNSIATWVDFGH